MNVNGKVFQDEFIDSPCFGKSLKLTGLGEDILKSLISEAPLAVFQTMNKTMNKKNLCFSISKIPMQETGE